MAELPAGFVVDKPQTELPEGFTVDATPQQKPNLQELAAQTMEKRLREDEIFGELAQREGVDISTLGFGGSQFKPIERAGTPRQQAMQELAGDTGWLEALGVSVGKGFMNVGRGLGIAEPQDEIEAEAMAALGDQYPGTTLAGEVVGEALPFVPAAVATGGISALAPRALATGLVGAVEGGVISKGSGGDVLTGAGLGGSIGLGAEVLMPVLGRLGRKVFQRVTGKPPQGAMLDAAGNPTQELNEALEAAGMTFDDLNQDAVEVITGQKPGADVEQVARKALFAEAGIPATKGEVTQEFGQQATEARLLESAEDLAAEPLRQFKLKQSEAIRDNLRSNFDFDVDQEGTGQLIQDALLGRKTLLRTQKNELYETAAENAKDLGGVPIMTDTMRDAVPAVGDFEDLAITAPAAMQSLDQILVKYGMKEATPEMMEAGFTPTPLTIENFERFRKTLNAIERGDQTGAASVAIRPIKDSLDAELDEVDNIMAGLQSKVATDAASPEKIAQVRDSLKGARKTVRQLKTEFSPQSIIGKVVDVKKDGVTQVTEASKIYSKIAANASPVEETRRLVKSLSKSGEKGEQALSSIRAATMMDLIDAGFGTESKKISGVKTFNPIAFKRRLEKIGQPKLKALFASDKETLRKLNNIEKIATDLTPPSGAVPKGSANALYDIANAVGLITLSAKIPGGTIIPGLFKKVAEPIKTGRTVRGALDAEPDVTQFRGMIEQQFPGISSALGIAPVLELQRGED